MKNYIISFLLLILGLSVSSNTGFAQANIDSVLNVINNNLRTTFGNLAGTSYSNKNFHMVIHQVPESRFTTYSDSIEDFDIWYAQYFEMFYSALDTTILPRYDSLYSISSKSREDTVPILIQDFNFHKFRDSIVFQSDTFFVFDTVNDVLYDNPYRPNSPYVAGGIFKGTNFKKSVSFADPVFKIDPQLIIFDAYTASDFIEAQLQIDFGDGLGFVTINSQTVNYIPVTYSSMGWKTITYRIILANGTVLKKSKSRLFVQSNKTRASFGLIEPAFSINGLDIMVEKGCEEMPKKPLILLTGFDLNNDLSPESWFADYFQDGQLNDVLDYGYDVYIVKYANPNGSIIANAMKVVKLLEHLKCTTYADSEEQFVMMGIGVGGIIGRYALTWMENPLNRDGESCKPDNYHNTRLFVSIDAPQQGYNIPMSLQYLYKDSPRIIPRMGANRERMEDYRKKVIDSPMGKQLLIYHVDSENSQEYERHIDGQNFFSNLSNWGNYPQYCKKIAIANGMGNGDHQTHDVTQVPQPDHSTLIYGGSKLRFYLLFADFTLWESTYQLFTNPPGNGMLINQDATLKIPKIKLKFWKLEIIKSIVNALIDEKGKKFHATGSAQGGYQGMGYIGIDPDPVQLKNSFDWAAGGLQLSFLNSGDPVINASGSILGMEFMNSGTAYSDGYRFNFIPTVSALDKGFNWTTPSLANINHNYINSGSTMIMLGTPFDVISMGTQAFNPPYQVPQTNNVLWSIKQNNDHNSKIRNENVTQYNESGWLLDEIGTERLNLENYVQNWSAHFVAVDQIALYNGTNPHFQYPAGPPPQQMEGTFSKYNTYLKNTNVVPSFELGVGGNFYDLGPYNNVYNPIYTNFNVCNQFQGYAQKKENNTHDSEEQKLESFDVNIFPNPNSNFCTIELGTEENCHVQILDVIGKLVYNRQNVKEELKINTAHWLNGLYLVKVHRGKNVKTLKWMKL